MPSAWEQELKVEARKRALKIIKKKIERLSKLIVKQAAIAEKAAKQAAIAAQAAEQAAQQLAEIAANNK